MQSLIGLLNFACRVISPGRPFLRRLINSTMGIQKPHHHISISKPIRADIAAWLSFLSSFNGISLFPERDVLDSEHLKLYTDASGSVGFAGVWGAKWFAGAWPESWPTLHITTKEMFPLTLLVEIWGERLAGKRILFHTDNAAVVHIINKQSCADIHTMALVRRLVVACIKFSIIFKATHIPGYTNVIADKLSRFSFQGAR